MEMGQLRNKNNNNNKMEKPSPSGCDTECQSDKN